MNWFRLPLVFGAVICLATVALISRDEAPVASKMADAAEKLLTSLNEEQLKKISFEFDDPHRVV